MKNLALANLQQLSLQGTLPHAWLFAGEDQIEKLSVAKQFCQWLICSAPDGTNACGKCKQCHLYTAGTHPDFCQIAPAEGNVSILIDDIRVLNDFMNGRPQFASKKVILITAAEKMNRQAANALLKNLEEPGADTILFLLATHPDLLLNTIVSRCQILRFEAKSLTTQETIDDIGLILQDLHNLFVTKVLTNLELVERWVKRWPTEVLYWFELVLADLIICKYTQDQSLLKYDSLYKEQAALNSKIHANRLWSMLQRVQEARYWFGTGHKPNLQLVLENIILE